MPGRSHPSHAAGFQQDRGHSLQQQGRADEQQHRRAGVTPVPHQQREEQADAEHVERALGGLDHVRRRVGLRRLAGEHALGRGIVGNGEQRDGWIHLGRKPQREQREPDVAKDAGQEEAAAPPRQPRARRGASRDRRGDGGAGQRAERVRHEVDDVRVARRNPRLQRLHHERHRESGDGPERHAPAGGKAVGNQRDECAERQVREQVDEDVEARRAHAARREQPERRVAGRCEEIAERLQAREHDRERVDRREDVRQARPGPGLGRRGVDGFAHASAGMLGIASRRRMTVTSSFPPIASKPREAKSDAGPW